MACEIEAEYAAAAEGRFAPLIDAVNARWREYKLGEGNPDDHFVFMAVRLAELKARAKDARVSFMRLVKGRLPFSYSIVWNLCKVGNAPNPALALREWRAKQKKENTAAVQRRKKQLLSSAMLPPAAARHAFGRLTPKEKMQFVNEVCAEVGGRFVWALDEEAE